MKIAISGSKGRMGSRIAELANDESGLEVAGAFDVGEDAEAPIAGCDCLIEFTSAQATMEHLDACKKLGKSMVIGTTGLSDADRQAIEDASKDIPIVFSPNMSAGVNVLFKLVSEAARALGRDYHINIVEAHHTEKKDSPSGTARELARIIKERRKGDEVPIDSVREGEIVGEHTVTFESDVDLVEITHCAKTRDIFAKGALKAAKFLADKKSGLYSMKDVLGL